MANTDARITCGRGAAWGLALIGALSLVSPVRAVAGSFFSGPLLEQNLGDTNGRPVIVTPPKLGGPMVDGIWQGDPFGYVVIVKSPSGVSTPSTAPERLNAAQLTRALSDMKMRVGQHKPTSVFVGDELKRLVPQLVKALDKLQAGEDVAFAVAGKRNPSNPFEPPRVITGRMFFHENDLNVIFGLMKGEFYGQYRETGILKAFNPGYRDHRESGGWELVPGDGMQLASSGRSDWAVLSPAAWKVSQPPVRTAAAAPSSQAPQNGGASASRSQAPQNAAPMQPVPPAQAYYERFKRRLEALQKLRKAGVITEKEYQKKRKQILNQL